MDPDACLENMLEIAGKVVDGKLKSSVDEDECEYIDAALGLAEHVLALHDWIRGGGFLPKEWRKP